MKIKWLSIVMIVFIVMISGCASSDDKWNKAEEQSSSNTESAWQQNQRSTENQEKKSPESYWSKEGRY